MIEMCPSLIFHRKNLGTIQKPLQKSVKSKILWCPTYLSLNCGLADDRNVSYYQVIQECLQTSKSLVQEVWFSYFPRMNILSSISDLQKKKICRVQFSDRKVSIFLKYRTYLTYCSKGWDGLCISWNIGIQPF